MQLLPVWISVLLRTVEFLIVYMTIHSDDILWIAICFRIDYLLRLYVLMPFSAIISINFMKFDE